MSGHYQVNNAFVSGIPAVKVFLCMQGHKLLSVKIGSSCCCHAACHTTISAASMSGASTSAVNDLRRTQQPATQTQRSIPTNRNCYSSNGKAETESHAPDQAHWQKPSEANRPWERPEDRQRLLTFYSDHYEVVIKLCSAHQGCTYASIESIQSSEHIQ